MYPIISLRQMEEMLDRGDDLFLVDLRNPDAFNQCHLKGAVNIPMNQLMDNLYLLSEGRIPYFYCSRGSKSLLACNQLTAMGREVACIGGGINFYRGKYLVS